MKTAREEQIQTLRESAEALRHTVKNTRDEAAEWQGQADKAREKADRDEENARVWELLADALDNGQLDNIVVPLGSGREEPTNARIHALQGRLMMQLSEYQLDAWNIHCGRLRAMLHLLHGGSREAIATVADRLDLRYLETPRSDGQVFVAASGEIDGIEVEIWSLLPADEKPAGDTGPHRGRPNCEGCPDCIGYTDPNEPDDEAEAAQETWIEQREAAVDEALSAHDAESGS